MNKLLIATVIILLIGKTYADQSSCLSHIVSAVSTNDTTLFGGGWPIRTAVLLDDGDLLIYSREVGEQAKLNLHIKDFAYGGTLAGQGSSLSINNKGSLRVRSYNDAISRNRWRKTLTIALRESELYVVGINYTDRDTLNLENKNHCEINLLTRHAEINGKSLILENITPIKLKEWKNELLYKLCGIDN